MLQIQVGGIGISGFLQGGVDEINGIFQIEIIFQNAVLQEGEIGGCDSDGFGAVTGLPTGGFKETGLRQRCANRIAGSVPAGVGNQLVDGIIPLNEKRQYGFLSLKVAAQINEGDRYREAAVVLQLLNGITARDRSSSSLSHEETSRVKSAFSSEFVCCPPSSAIFSCTVCSMLTAI